MVKLRNTFNRDGFVHKIIWRDDEYAITRLTDDETGRFICLEAFRIIVKEKGHPNSRSEYPREALPQNEQWGKYGFTIYDMDKAMEKIEIMRQRSINRKNKIKN